MHVNRYACKEHVRTCTSPAINARTFLQQGTVISYLLDPNRRRRRGQDLWASYMQYVAASHLVIWFWWWMQVTDTAYYLVRNLSLEAERMVFPCRHAHTPSHAYTKAGRDGERVVLSRRPVLASS